mgnify:CR=1 FL=1
MTGRTPPSPAHEPSPSPARRHLGQIPQEAEFDALTDLFLGPEAEAALELADAPSARHTPGVTRRRVEGVLLGHLPVRAGVWVNQYARALVEREGVRVAVVRAREGSVTVSLAGPPTPTNPDAESLADAAAAVRFAVVHAGVVLLEVGELDEPGLVDLSLGRVRASGVSMGLTVLSGSDDAAAVAAYRAGKRLSEALGDPEAVAGAPVLRAAVFGADPVRADRAVEKLVSASRAFLRGPIEATACVSRIGGPRVRELHHGPTEAEAGDILAWILEAASEASPNEPHANAPHAPRLRLTSEAAGAISPEPAHAQVEAAGLAEEPPIVVTRPRIPAHRATIAPPARSNGTPQPATATDDDDLDVALDRAFGTQAGVAPAPQTPQASREAPAASEPATGEGAPTVPGLRLLDVRCPVAPGVHLAADAGNRLHLLALEGSARGGLGVARGTGAGHLAAADAWARANAALLRAATGVDADAPTMHLLTDEPREARGLLDSSIRVHLAFELTPAGGGRPVWICRAVN